MTNEFVERLKRSFSINTIIYYALISTIFIIIAFAFILLNRGLLPENNSAEELREALPILRIALFGVSAVEVIVSFFLRKILSDPQNLLKRMRGNFAGEVDLKAPVGEAETKNIMSIIQFIRSIDIISWTLCQSVAVYGLILTILSREVIYVEAFGVLALLALAFQRPNFSNYTRLLEATFEELQRTTDKPAVEADQ